MMDLDAVNKQWRTLIRAIMGMPENTVHQANKDGIPAGGKGSPFATVLLTTLVPSNQAEHKLVEIEDSTDITESATVQYVGTLSVQFFRANAYGLATALNNRLQMSQATEKLQLLNMGLVSVGPVRDLSQVVSTFWEARAQLDITFHIIDQEDAVIPTYGTATFDFTYGDSATTTFEVTLP